MGRRPDALLRTGSTFGQEDRLTDILATGVSDDGVTVWHQFEPPEGSWLQRLQGVQCAAELVLSDRDYWTREMLGKPAFAAGFSLEGRLHDPLSAKREWVQRLADAGFCCAHWARPRRPVQDAPDG